jgi:hypothetical protein
MRTSGACVLTFGRSPPFARNASHTASLMRSVTKSRLFSGQRTAARLTRMVRSTSNHCGHGSASVALNMSSSVL